MKRFKIVPRQFARHKTTGQVASLYGSCPWYTELEKRKYWEIVTEGFSVHDLKENHIGIGGKFETSEAAEIYVEEILIKKLRYCSEV